MHHRRSILILISHLFLLHPSISEPDSFSDCSAATLFSCGNVNYSVSFPFGSPGRSPRCSYPSFKLTCGPLNSTLINISSANLYQVKRIDYDNRVLTVVNPYFVSQTCPSVFGNSTLDYALVWYTTLDANVTVYVNCEGLPSNFDLLEIKCLAGESRRSYYSFKGEIIREVAAMCETAGIVSMNLTVVDGLKGMPDGFVAALQEGFGVTWAVGQDWCPGCVDSGGVCGYDPVHPDDWTCFCPNTATASRFGTCDGTSGKDNGKLIAIGVSVGVASLILACVLCFFCWRCKKRRTSTSSNFLVVRNVSPDPSSLKDPEFGSMNYHTHLFSYEELQEATNGFDESRELGDGGFGTVYKGKLRDGRIVAVKRLYENNYKRVEQFMNEIEILSHLHHENLVTLYGCTSRHSRELLLVYEFVSNGTVADHLHGSSASLGALTWPVRLSIAIETACALAYLHAVEPQIIHRDVKTNNILLDDSFHVKVADFGLSRLFPVNASHVSTLPQGTPGYVDPEYHQCYQLTDKSDVYSFGVVLVELISSKPAVDISRHRHEINLANMAINRIQSCKLEELIDPGLGHGTDKETERMITMVAELAFRCLQGDKDMRPCIKEVLEELERIRDASDNAAESDELTREEPQLLKNLSPFSPDSVTVRWDSSLTTPNASE